MVSRLSLDLQAILSNTGSMHQITDTLFVGNIYEAEKPPAQIGAVLLVAEEFTPDPPAGVIYERIPLKEFGEVKAASLDQAVEWIARHHPDNRVLVCCRAGMGAVQSRSSWCTFAVCTTCPIPTSFS
jgi:protein-tyrosine phosphatase